MPVARIVGAIGRGLITAGVLLLLFVAYQLYGTGLAEARAQDDLRDDFEAALAAAPPDTTAPPATTPPAPTTTAEAPGQPGEPGEPAAAEPPPTVPPVTAAAPPPPPRTPRGQAVAILRIPAIGVDKAVVEGVGVGDLKKGPGHYPGTPLPGQRGNSAIAGHRTTYGAPFGDLGALDEGDEIRVTTRQGEFRYVVDRISVVAPSQVEVLRQTEEARLTLTTCHPRFSARQRLVVSGVLVDDPGPGLPPAPPDGESAEAPDADDEPDPGAPVPGDGPDPGGPDDDPVVEGADDLGGGDDLAGEGPDGTDVGAGADLVAFDDPGLTGDPSARAPAAGWGAATALVALGAWLLGRRWRRWPAYLLALPVGAATLFQCFEQVARLFPANI